jgi:glycosyltransferase involved in cell wall biosynthesis
MALVEAMASARPMLITRYCHMPIVETAEVGFVVDPSPEGIADGLRKLLSMSDLEVREMGARARQLFLDNYTWDRVSEMLEAVYLRAIEGRAAAVAA